MITSVSDRTRANCLLDYNLSKADWPGINALLATINWFALFTNFTDIDVCWDVFCSTVCNAIMSLSPAKRPCRQTRNNMPSVSKRGN